MLDRFAWLITHFVRLVEVVEVLHFDQGPTHVGPIIQVNEVNDRPFQP